MTPLKRKILRWFQRRGWHTGGAKTGGAFLEAPVQPKSGTFTDGRYKWRSEHYFTVSVSELAPGQIRFSVYKRNEYTEGPDFQKRNKPWPYQPEVSFITTIQELREILMLADACAEELEKGE